MSKYMGLRNEEGCLLYDPSLMQISLDTATLFNYSADKGQYTTRGLVTYKGFAAPLDIPGLAYTTTPYGVVRAASWVMMRDGSEPKILMGLQGAGNKAYALIHHYPLRESSKHSYEKDEDLYRVKLNVAECPIKTFGLEITNRAGFMAAKSLDDCLRSSHIFSGMYLGNSKAIQTYDDTELGPNFSEKLEWVFESMLQRKRKQIGKDFAGNKTGELEAVKAFMEIVEPERMALEKQAAYYNIALCDRIFQVEIAGPVDAMPDNDITSEALDTLSSKLE